MGSLPPGKPPAGPAPPRHPVAWVGSSPAFMTGEVCGCPVSCRGRRSRCSRSSPAPGTTGGHFDPLSTHFGQLFTLAWAVGVVLSPPSPFPFSRIQVGDVRPTAFYLVAGLMAVSISQVTSLVFNSVAMGGIQPGWARFQLTYPWMLITFGTALITAVLVDNPTFHGMSRWQQRCIEGFLQAAVMLGVAYLTHCWLVQRSEVIGVVRRVPPLASVMGMSGMVGFVIGFCIPTWYRQAQRRHRKVLAGASVSMLSFRGSPATQ